MDLCKFWEAPESQSVASEKRVTEEREGIKGREGNLCPGSVGIQGLVHSLIGVGAKGQ